MKCLATFMNEVKWNTMLVCKCTTKDVESRESTFTVECHLRNSLIEHVINLKLTRIKIYYIVKYDLNVLLDLEDDEDVKDLVLHSNEFACVYIVHSAREECAQEEIVDAKNSNFCISRKALCNTKQPIGFASRSMEREVKPLESQRHHESVKPLIQVTYDRRKKRSTRGGQQHN